MLSKQGVSEGQKSEDNRASLHDQKTKQSTGFKGKHEVIIMPPQNKTLPEAAREEKSGTEETTGGKISLVNAKSSNHQRYYTLKQGLRHGLSLHKAGERQPMHLERAHKITPIKVFGLHTAPHSFVQNHRLLKSEHTYPSHHLHEGEDHVAPDT